MAKQREVEKKLNEKIVVLSNTKDLRKERKIKSHRKVIGPLLVKVRNKIKEEIDLTLEPVLDEQIKFNNNLVDAINLLKKEKSLNVDKIERIRKEVSLPEINYIDFEDEYRGSQNSIKKNLKRFVDFFLDRKDVIDIGCGRGEFLELLRDNKIGAKGIDINDDMIKTCIKKKLKVEKMDALSYLENVDDNSLGGIFSSQVIEHMKPGYLYEFIKLSFKKLKKGCFFVAETINPQSFYAFSHHYLTDLSHQMPIHFETMKFLLRSIGFKDVKIEFREEVSKKEKLAEVKDKTMNNNIKKLNKLLYGWQDYAVIGKKA